MQYIMEHGKIYSPAVIVISLKKTIDFFKIEIFLLVLFFFFARFEANGNKKKKKDCNLEAI